MRVILPAEHIPEGSTVTKVTGHKEYTLVHRIEVYQEDGSKYTMACKDGARFITADGIATAIDPNAELVWHVDPNDLIRSILAQEKRVDRANEEVIEAVKRRRLMFPDVVDEPNVPCRCAIGGVVTGVGMDERGRNVLVVLSAEFCEYMPIYRYAGAALCHRHEIMTRPADQALIVKD